MEPDQANIAAQQHEMPGHPVDYTAVPTRSEHVRTAARQKHCHQFSTTQCVGIQSTGATPLANTALTTTKKSSTSLPSSRTLMESMQHPHRRALRLHAQDPRNTHLSMANSLDCCRMQSCSSQLQCMCSPGMLGDKHVATASDTEKPVTEKTPGLALTSRLPQKQEHMHEWQRIRVPTHMFNRLQIHGILPRQPNR